jgi:hypothetical protein
MQSNSVILWRGPSLLDGAPIVVIASGLNSSANSKTGNMLQTYILRDDISPVNAARTGDDSSVCGACPHRGVTVTDAKGEMRNKGRTCYVNLGQGPLSVWRAFKRGALPTAAEILGAGPADAIRATGRGRVVRLGTYGDPAAVPAAIWRDLIGDAIGHTGYTHQWRNAPELRALCMASCDSELEAADAQLHGWRTFRAALPGMPARAPRYVAPLRESVCPASAEAGRKLQCAQCLACSGANGRRGSIVIQAHGGFAVMANIRRRANQLQGAAASVA